VGAKVGYWMMDVGYEVIVVSKVYVLTPPVTLFGT
jgi:hypothetical protein